MNQERLLQIILAPIVSEKSTLLSEKYQQIVLRVASNATKPEIKAAVEMLFNVKVGGVSTVKVKGKVKRFGRSMGRRSDWKKAYVRLADGQEVDLGAASALAE
ncbi:50S ribosomal protein L23 [Neisseriaceae bacterium TC5R-5]|nr:50S ribosomal protein L23 [Neisseriaceae bacterium TC5R-5]